MQVVFTRKELIRRAIEQIRACIKVYRKSILLDDVDTCNVVYDFICDLRRSLYTLRIINCAKYLWLRDIIDKMLFE